MPDAPGSPLPDPQLAYPFPLRKLLIVLVFAPILWLGFLMYVYGVDTPYWDEWDEIPAGLMKIHDGTLTWSDLIAQHNEHRILFPRIVLLATAWLTSWNVRAELFVIWLLACVCSLSLWRLSRITGSTGSNWDLVIFAAANVLFFTPVAFENWLWGFQVSFLLPLAALTLALWLVSASRKFLAFFFAIVLSFICTFSMASGFLCWFIVLPLLLFPEGRLQWRDRIPGLVCWLAGLVGSVVYYLHGYIREADSPGLFLVVQQPGDAIQYLLFYLGSAFGWHIGPKALMGFGATWLALLAGALHYLWRSRADERLIAQTLPWVMLSGYALMNGLVTMIGRLSFGPTQATAPRYITFAVLLPIGLLFILQRIYQHWRRGPVTRPQVQVFRTFLVACLVVGVGANLYCALIGFGSWKDWRRARQFSKVLVEFVEVTQEEALTKKAHLTYGDPAKLREYSRRMGELGYLRPAPVSGGAISAVADLSAASSSDYGSFDGTGQGQDGQLYAFGWAVLPDQVRFADAVLLTYEDKAHPGAPTIFSVVHTGLRRSDVVDSTRQDEYEYAGWARPLTPGLLPPGPHLLRAWAFDFQENRAWPLEGSYEYNEATLAPSDEKKPPSPR